MGMIGWAKDSGVKRLDKAAAHLWIEDENGHPASLCGRRASTVTTIKREAIKHGEPAVNLCLACQRVLRKIAAEYMDLLP